MTSERINELWTLACEAMPDDGELFTAAQCAKLRELRRELFREHEVQTAREHDRATPADPEWFAGLPGVERRERSLAWTHASMLIGIRYYLDGERGPLVWILGHPWPGGHPTRGQVLDAMAALGGKGGDA